MGKTLVLHFGAIQPYIVNGNGTLDMTMTNRNGTANFTPNIIDMNNLNPNQAPVRRTNLVAQKAKVRISTDQMDEQFEITTLTVWVKPIWTTLPIV